MKERRGNPANSGRQPSYRERPIINVRERLSGWKNPMNKDRMLEREKQLEERIFRN